MPAPSLLDVEQKINILDQQESQWARDQFTLQLQVEASESFKTDDEAQQAQVASEVAHAKARLAYADHMLAKLAAQRKALG